MTQKTPMHESEFDRFAEEYKSQLAESIAFSGETPDYFAEYKIRDIAEIVKAAGLDEGSMRVLDFGAGVGNSVPFFKKYLPTASVTCLDVSRKSLDLGQARFDGQADFVHFEGGDLPFANGTFDIILCACVLHHIDHPEHKAILARLRGLLSERGSLYIFEHNPLNPLTVRVVNSCPFDENAKLITARALQITLLEAGYSQVETRYRIFFPGALRQLRFMEKFLRWCPAGAQYSLIARR